MIEEIGTVPKGSFLVTLDVSLYPNMPIAESIAACAAGLAEFRSGGTEPKNSCILRLLKLVRISNHFMFCGEHYLQISGTATGTRAAPNVAITFMNKFEDTHVYIVCASISRTDGWPVCPCISPSHNLYSAFEH